jgi:stearoyl-CoA desaturase (delta-9 desaturase)
MFLLVFSLLISHWYTSLFFQSLFLHRYCAHRMYELNPFWEKIFYILTFISQGPSFLNPGGYSVMHQQHHAYSDTERDPHSPYNSKSFWSMMIKSFHYFNKISRNHKKEMDASILHRAPTWDLIDDFAFSNWSYVVWVCLYFSVYYYLNIPLIYYPFLLIHFFMGPIHGGIVNYCGHKFGYRNYELKDKSTNALPVDFALMGELYQNNHHRFGNDINFAKKWFEIDPTYQIAKILDRLHIIKIMLKRRAKKVE